VRPFCLTIGFLIVSAVSLAASDIEAGRRVYRDGQLASGASLRGVLENDVEVRAEAASCARCHRPSGFGSNEGATLVPPITGPALFHSREPRRADMIRRLYQDVLPDAARASARTPRSRPAYTSESLAVALRTGVDPEGRPLDPLMPRYPLNDEDMGHLVAYLKGLAVTPDPGVDGRQLHLATVISGGVEPSERQALTAVLDAFVRTRNLEDRRERQRPGLSPNYKDEYRAARREWVLHTWELEGPAATWEQQLEGYYRRQPVFALVGGLVQGDWKPVHEFCQRTGLPCLFPITDLPAIPDVESESPTIYFSKGLALEAEALAVWLSEPGRVPAGSRIVQVYRPGPEGTALSASFRRALRKDLRGRLDDLPVARDDALSPEFWRHLVDERAGSTLILWLTAEDLSSFHPAVGAEQRTIYLSGGLLGEKASTLPESLRFRVMFTYIYTIPGREVPAIYRARAWLRSRGVGRGPERVQLGAYFAMSVLEHASVRMVDHFSRPYLIECVEHEVENALNPGLYPSMSLGPGQRFCSKGSYIVEPSRSVRRGVEPVSAWIIP